MSKEAADLILADFEKHWSRHGASWISYVTRAGGNGQSDPDADEYVERRGVSAVCLPETLTAADKLNDITWKGTVWLDCEAQRAYFFRNAEATFAHGPETKGWNDWTPPNRDERFWGLSLQKRNGAWKSEPGLGCLPGPDRGAWQRVDCDAGGATSFDPAKDRSARLQAVAASAAAKGQWSIQYECLKRASGCDPTDPTVTKALSRSAWDLLEHPATTGESAIIDAMWVLARTGDQRLGSFLSKALDSEYIHHHNIAREGNIRTSGQYDAFASGLAFLNDTGSVPLLKRALSHSLRHDSDSAGSFMHALAELEHDDRWNTFNAWQPDGGSAFPAIFSFLRDSVSEAQIFSNRRSMMRSPTTLSGEVVKGALDTRTLDLLDDGVKRERITELQELLISQRVVPADNWWYPVVLSSGEVELEGRLVDVSSSATTVGELVLSLKVGKTREFPWRIAGVKRVVVNGQKYLDGSGTQ